MLPGLRRAAAVGAAAALALVPVLAAPAGAGGQTLVRTGADGVPEYRLAPGAVPAPVRPQTTAHQADYTVSIGGRDRVFRLYVPPGLNGRAAPLVLGLHSLYSDRRKAQSLMGWDRLADRAGFVAVYPQGTGASWNAGRCCGAAVRERVDDVGALAEMQRLAAHAHPVDPRRRYATGFSNGGMMAMALACARPELVAGVLVVAGGHLASCRPARSVPVLQVHGTADTVVPYGGTAHSDFLATSVPPVGETQRLWAGVNAPRAAPTRLVRIVGGGHSWPRGSGTAGTPYDTTGAGWAFLRDQRSRCVPAWQAVRPGRREVCR